MIDNIVRHCGALSILFNFHLILLDVVVFNSRLQIQKLRLSDLFI